ncbi:copper chaperone for superoxide dismutase-like isoform X1 [Melanotaenia boesemani]|uniref:copper chaperone for superoxide dismutase-like isoform X1 n=1 Tax=Melanotaenia boesemani TaxID=1250792 RepID=UPI001C05A7E9|nr:copper chaperone for superoxide dismutase-like isoform X1 [Melanotaenia boesemani]
MAATVSTYSSFASVSRKLGSFLFNSVFITQAVNRVNSMDSDRPTKLEFAVQMTCESCAEKVRAALEGKPGVTSVSIDVGKEEVLVECALTSAEVQALIESTGRRAVLKAIGGSERDLGAAVAMLAGAGSIQGVVRFLQLSEGQCLIDGTIDGLDPGPHGLHVHTLGDLTQDCLSCGEHYNPFERQHGGPGDSERHVGDLGNIVAGPDGRASFRLEDGQLKVTQAHRQTCLPQVVNGAQEYAALVQVWDVIGRSLVVDAGEDDLGRGGHPLSKQTGNSGERLACGIIARSAGIFQNPKRICACDGVTLWEERDRPIAGKGRSKTNSETPAAHL